MISDSDEVAYGLDLLKNDANDDSDNDGLSNIKEVNYKTNPLDNDTDKDKILMVGKLKISLIRYWMIQRKTLILMVF